MQALIVNYLGQSNQIYISLYGRENIVDVEYGLAGHCTGGVVGGK